jgi:hypothetical protein
VPDAAALTELLKKERLPKIRITKVAEVEMAKEDAVFQITISGLG